MRTHRVLGRFGGALLLLAAAPLEAGVAPKESRFTVSSGTAHLRKDTYGYVTVDGAGNSVIVRSVDDGDRLKGRRMSRGGKLAPAEFLVDADPSDAALVPSVAASSTGAFTVVWGKGSTDGWDVRARRFDPTGTAGEPDFPVSGTGTLVSLAIATNSSGRSVAAYSKVAGVHRIFATIFDDDGIPVGPEFQVNDPASGEPLDDPDVAMDESGNFVVVWRGGAPGDDDGIIAKGFDSAGSASEAEFRVNAGTVGPQSSPVVAMGTEGEFVVVWSGPTSSHASAPGGILARKFDAKGVPTGGDAVVDSEVGTPVRFPDVAMGSSGDFVVVWRRTASDEPDVNYFVSANVMGRAMYGRAPEFVSPDPHAGSLDCADPSAGPPTFTWERDGYDKFRVIASWDRNFAANSRITSGERLLTSTSWTPDADAWTRVCSHAFDGEAQTLRVFVVGVDADLPERDPARRRPSATVLFNVSP